MTAKSVAGGARALGQAPDPCERSRVIIAPTDAEVADLLLALEQARHPISARIPSALANSREIRDSATSCARAEIRG